MNKNALISCIAALAVLVAVVATAVFFLYTDGGNSGKKAVVTPRSEYKLLSAVPSDAAMLMCFSKTSEAIATLNDSTQVFGVLLTDACNQKHPFLDFVKLCKGQSLGDLRSGNAVVSLHYSGTMEPLMIISAGSVPADTTSDIRRVMALADSAKLHTSLVDCSSLVSSSSKLHKSALLLVSPSNTLLTAVERHLEGGMSVLDKESFPQAAAAAGGSDALFFSHDYASKIFPTFLQKQYSSYSSFFSRFADWTVLAISGNNTRKFSMRGSSVSSDNAQGSFVTVFSGSDAGETLFANVAPAATVFAVSLSVGDVSDYSDSYRKYLDAAGKLDRFNSVSKSLKDSLGVSPLQWAEKLAVKEVAIANILADGASVPVSFVRVGKENADMLLKGTDVTSLKELKGVHDNPFHGYVTSVFGSLFASDDSSALYRDGWLILGPAGVLDILGEDKLKSSLSQMDLSVAEKGSNLTAYFSISGNDVRQIFRPALAEAFRRSLMGVTDAAALFSISGDDISLDVARANVVSAAKSVSSTTVRDTVVNVPEGPFKVKNSGTGKTNLFSQASNGSLSLKDENGKGLWGIPFQGKICGMVETIDYYANDKLQFLFASGSKLYLIDRLGRFVSPFPVELGKTIVLGPAAYDFTGAKGYSAMVLHSDNTVGLYDLHGKLRSGWQGITSSETIKSLPELVEAGGKKYWAVRTSVQTLIYPFNGGEPLTKLSGDKMIRPDSEINVKDGTISATCLDGKVRNVKL